KQLLPDFKMVVDDLQFMSVLKGKRIKLTLKTASYFGVVQLCLFFFCCFFFIKRISYLFCIFAVQYIKINRTKSFKLFHLGSFFNADDEDEDEFIDFVVIDEFHEKFGPAVMHIKKQHVIGVAAEGVEVFKSGRLCWLQIATKNKVYLFDILLLGARAFKNGLSMILESKHILKVIHDCRAIGGCLITQFGVKLANIFDTQVADVMCFYSETGGFLPDRVSTLQAVVNLHLKVLYVWFPGLSVCVFLQEEREMWYKRPCPVSLLKVLALSVIHLQPLRLVLLDTLMSDYMALVDSYLSSSHYEPDELEHVNMVGDTKPSGSSS
uniref:3'-5' exonuclease domain-containing protein n=1 Tax=Stegastes partitus TaxID=144197 RepID=A0A3B5BDD6_9TELE